MTLGGLPEPPVLLITDRRMAARPLPDIVTAAIGGGCRWILVREKDLPPDRLTKLVSEIVALAVPHNAIVSVSGAAASAAIAGAQGVHLPQAETGRNAVANARNRLGSGALIGVSSHSIEEAETAARDGADYITFSPIFPTPSKPGYGPTHGLDGLTMATAQLSIPVLALAGVDTTNTADCRDAGAAGVAIMGSVMHATDPCAAVAATIAAWRS